MIQPKWIFNEVDEGILANLTEELNVPKAIAKALINRGIKTKEEAQDFFKPDYKKLHDPFLMKDMEKAVARIDKAILSEETIMIYGDYDVDGTTAVAVVYDFLDKNCSTPANLHYYIPNRYHEGYGISFKGIDEAIALGCTLMIALDCGIKANDKVAYANEKGLDLIICDHHLPGNELPDAVAILNPKQEDCHYPFKELSGCGIGYKLIQALAIHWQITDEKATNDYLDLVATSIAADIVPIIGENRILAYYGLMKANKKPSLPVKVLKETAGVRAQMNISNLVFMLSPRINAAGRMDDAKKAVSFFLEKDKACAQKKAAELHSDNNDRKDLDRSITKEALAILDDEVLLLERKSIVVHQDNWHKGVVGIVASRLVEAHYKPTIVLTTSNGKITGSARSVDGFNIHDAISQCSHLLESFGGHQFAAGLTMMPDNLSAFQQIFEEYVRLHIQEESLIPKLYIDDEIRLDDLQFSLLQFSEAFEPCGPQNMMPVYIARKVKNSGGSRIVKGEHLQLHIQQDNGPSYKGIAFGCADWYERIKDGQLFDIAFHMQRNEWNGVVYTEFQVLDMRLADN